MQCVQDMDTESTCGKGKSLKDAKRQHGTAGATASALLWTLPPKILETFLQISNWGKRTQNLRHSSLLIALATPNTNLTSISVFISFCTLCTETVLSTIMKRAL